MPRRNVYLNEKIDEQLKKFEAENPKLKINYSDIFTDAIAKFMKENHGWTLIKSTEQTKNAEAK